MFWDVLDKPRQSLLKSIVASPPIRGAYLAGGTALALQYGHRLSEDFDWFLPESFDPGKLPALLECFGTVSVAETHAGTFHGWIDGIRVTWLHYPNPLLDPLQEVRDLPGPILLLLIKSMSVAGCFYVLTDIVERYPRKFASWKSAEYFPRHVERVAYLPLFFFTLFEEFFLKQPSKFEGHFVIFREFILSDDTGKGADILDLAVRSEELA